MQHRGFRQLPHTADVAFEAWGLTIAAVYEESVLALFALMGEPQTLSTSEPFEISSAGVDREDLLVRLLSDLLARFEIEARWVTSATCGEPTRDDSGDLVVTVVCDGGRIDRDNEPGLEEIKAVTYHGLSVTEDENGVLRARVVLDV